MKCYKHFPDKSRKSVSTGDVWKQYLVFARPLTSVLRSSLKSKEPIELNPLTNLNYQAFLANIRCENASNSIGRMTTTEDSFV